jgi:hypothetical protein
MQLSAATPRLIPFSLLVWWTWHEQAGADAVLVVNDHAGDLSTAVTPDDEGAKA